MMPFYYSSSTTLYVHLVLYIHHYIPGSSLLPGTESKGRSFINLHCIFPAESNGYITLGTSCKLYTSSFLNNFKPDVEDLISFADLVCKYFSEPRVYIFHSMYYYKAGSWALLMIPSKCKCFTFRIIFPSITFSCLTQVGSWLLTQCFLCPETTAGAY